MIKKILYLVGEDRQKQPDEQPDPEETVKIDFESKLKLMQRVIGECLSRLLVQNAYLAELKELFRGLNGRCQVMDEEGGHLEAWLQAVKKRLYVAQMSVVEYAETRRVNSQCLVKNLSFYCLVDILNRFFMVYNIKSINFD